MIIHVSPAQYFALEIIHKVGMKPRIDNQAIKLEKILIDWYESHHKPLLAKFIQSETKGEIFRKESL